MAALGVIIFLVGLVSVVKPLSFIGLKKRWHGLIVLIAGVVLMAVSGPSAPVTTNTATPAPAATLTPLPTAQAVQQQTWQRVAHWSGSGMKETESFSVASREWRISWSTKNEQVSGILQIYVHNDAGRMVSLAANVQGAKSDVSYVRSGPGKHYLQINSANVDWDITVEDQR